PPMQVFSNRQASSLPRRCTTGGIRAEPHSAIGIPALLQRRMSGSQPGDRDTVRRTRHVVQTDTVAEGDGARLAPMLTADPHLESGACGTSVPRPHGYELPDALLIQH